MATVKFDYGKWDGILGYQCGQCGVIIPYIMVAIEHENEIDKNEGICPNAKITVREKKSKDYWPG